MSKQSLKRTNLENLHYLILRLNTMHLDCGFCVRIEIKNSGVKNRSKNRHLTCTGLIAFFTKLPNNFNVDKVVF